MSAISYLFDENVTPLYRRELLRRQGDLTARQVGQLDAPPLSTLDPDILLWCERHLFILVTNNRHSMPDHLQDHLAQGHHVPGILVLNPKMDFGETVEELLLIYGASDEEEYHDQIAFLPVSS